MIVKPNFKEQTQCNRYKTDEEVINIDDRQLCWLLEGLSLVEATMHK